MIKSPNVAGAFYPSSKEAIMKMMKEFFANVQKDHHQLSSDRNHQLSAVVAPHAWYIYSGQIAAYSYTALQEYIKHLVPSPKSHIPTFVILAPSHYEYFEGVSVWLFDKFETPLGTIDTDMALGKKLINDYPDYFSFVPAAYDQEHSYEVQLPFLQYILQKSEVIVQSSEKNRKDSNTHNSSLLTHNFKILPLVFWNVNPIEVGNILYELSKKEEMFFIVSSDLSHFMEYSNAVKTDEETLQDFVDKDIDKIVHEADACGIHPRLALTQIAIKAKWTPELLKYMNSGDTAGDKSRVVWYWALIYH